MEKASTILTDNQLMQIFVHEGDNIAFERLYHKYKDALIRFSYGYTFNHAKAEEIVHETFLKVYRFKDSYDPKKTFSTWLWTICKNTNLDSLDKTKNYKEEYFNDTVLESLESTDSALEEMISNAAKETLHKAIQTLAISQREALLLWMNDDLNFEEMGQILGKSGQAVKNLVHRAKLGIKSELEKIKE
jgi:RNA polymerase sigma-70 factor (ECF subfamily)